MILYDVNIWVYSFRSDSPFHSGSRAFLENEFKSRGEFLLSAPVVSSFVRLVTNSRVFTEPSSLREAWDFVDALESQPSAVYADYDEMAFGIFKHLCLVSDCRGNSVPDAFLAALAIRYDAELVTRDTGFAKFAGLKARVLS